MHLVLTHTKYQFLETIRVPVAVIGAAFFPAAAMVFFVVPFVGDHRVGATFATASMVTFAVMTSCLFQYGVGVSEDRAQPWDPYTRTLPAGAWPRFVARIINGFIFIGISVLPVIVVAAVFTEASVTALQFLIALCVLFVVAVPFTLMGLAIGYLLPMKAALAVAQILFFPLAFGGGLFAAPGHSPGFVELIAPYLPTRGAVELMWASVGDFPVDGLSLAMLLVWAVAVGSLAVWAYRRDEGRRFA